MLSEGTKWWGCSSKLLREELDRLLLAKVEDPAASLTAHGATAVNAVLQVRRAIIRCFMGDISTLESAAGHNSPCYEGTLVLLTDWS